MTSMQKVLAALILALLSASCSQQVANTTSVSYVAVDPKKFENKEAVATAIALAQKECSVPENATNYQTGRNAVSAVKASNSELNAAAIDACMAGRGFLRKE